MTDDAPGAVELLPCGCKMYTQDGIFMFEPHSLTCQYYLYLLEEAARQDMPVNTLEF